ncbi:PREDICTED: homologous-pairing protein 2 homolog [Priapulus caudatus]|uniref:Homologous-pairing protein 2 homolog n=1 Tax=Priapulus caudatus TaxID=37621 RepID=A0ABM1DZI6_PRICU|nr:PREDICTED: homologous-pairing protein 2 homolog [Priapulus caudatus]XP_014665358.1 PREDICTED: homologous-pairing protein 2 homolog [Priapulus caudatus]XP_014665359.1 PREDICTED: homologous-pairing protein 2 homolog [Priapulus caudatus]
MSKGGNDHTAEAAILAYLNRENRPYSAIDIFNNLHKEYGKTAVVRALESMAEKGSIKEKVYGKQKVYLPDQSGFPVVDDAELKKMDMQINQMTEKLKGSQGSLHTMENEIKTLKSSLTTEQAMDRLQAIEDECERYQHRLKKIKGVSNAVSPEEKDKIYKAKAHYMKEWRKRKRMTMDVLNAILDGYPKSKKELLEEIGLETDEDCGVCMPKT